MDDRQEASFEICSLCGGKNTEVVAAIQRYEGLRDGDAVRFEVVAVFHQCQHCGAEYVTPEQYSENFTRFMDAKTESGITGMVEPL